jgi:hypothetical protein
MMANKQTSYMIYKAEAQSILSYDCETWVITSRMLKKIGEFSSTSRAPTDGPITDLSIGTQECGRIPPLGMR